MTNAAKGSALAGGDPDHLREAVIFAVLIQHPELAERFEAGIENMRCRMDLHRDFRDVILRHWPEGPDALREKILGALGANALENLFAARHVAVIPCIRTPGDTDLASMTLAEELAKLEAAQGLLAEIDEAAEDLTGVADEGLTWRLAQAAQAADTATRSGQEDTAEYDLGENGAQVSRSEREAFDALMEKIRFSKPGR